MKSEKKRLKVNRKIGKHYYMQELKIEYLALLNVAKQLNLITMHYHLVEEKQEDQDTLWYR